MRLYLYLYIYSTWNILNSIINNILISCLGYVFLYQCDLIAPCVKIFRIKFKMIVSACMKFLLKCLCGVCTVHYNHLPYKLTVNIDIGVISRAQGI